MISRNARKQQSARKRRRKPTAPPATSAMRRVHSRASSHQRQAAPARRQAGLSLVEVLISLAITSILLAATMVAIDTSFKAYAAAAESATTQASTRLVTHRLLALMRTSTAHAPTRTEDAKRPVTITGNTIESPYIELVDARGNLIEINYHSDQQELTVTTTPYPWDSSTPTTHPLIGGVTDCTFHLHRRETPDGVYVLERGSINLTVAPDRDNTLAIEADGSAPIRIVASTMPRKLN
ncbi:MAG: prepilin-type N-terminal cleavage/methylation domain-containing protein [Phycisphaeraceae bacterium]